MKSGNTHTRGGSVWLAHPQLVEDRTKSCPKGQHGYPMVELIEYTKRSHHTLNRLSDLLKCSQEGGNRKNSYCCVVC